MRPTTSPRPGLAGDVDHDDNLESVIALSGGDTALSYRVIKNGEPVGELSVKDLVRALVPTETSEESVRSIAV